MTGFSGSYDPGDVTFLLKVIELAPLPLERRERLIQSGQRHYSEMIGPEAAPAPEYLKIFHAALERNLGRLARDVVRLAALIANSRPGPVTLVSLARSGTPVGVLVGRILKNWLQRECAHYSISIIRDRGVDQNALNRLLAERPAESVVFVDGWTGKGVIARELKKALADYNRRTGRDLAGTLAVLTDLAGVAGLAVGADDYLIPTALLNSVVAGLISRTILNDELIGPNDFHGCLYYKELAPQDLSRWLVERVLAQAKLELASDPSLWAAQPLTPAAQERAAQANATFMAKTRQEFGVVDDNLIKPGLGEATRVLLRRAPGLLLLRDPTDPDVAHALSLAAARATPIRAEPGLPYRAVAIIKDLKGQATSAGPDLNGPLGPRNQLP
ncbi:MAG: cysteine protease StiP family protein [Deltaproteobacteria bacterium]|nr:cysteine protease StiP family protein [Deltaproteobacteria bacterium]